MPNCEECEESEQHGMGKCTKCAGVFELYQGTCNDSELLNICIVARAGILLICIPIDCGIPNCILCDKLDNKCIQCKEGYQLTSDGKCEGKHSGFSLFLGIKSGTYPGDHRVSLLMYVSGNTKTGFI